VFETTSCRRGPFCGAGWSGFPDLIPMRLILARRNATESLFPAFI